MSENERNKQIAAVTSTSDRLSPDVKEYLVKRSRYLEWRQENSHHFPDKNHRDLNSIVRDVALEEQTILDGDQKARMMTLELIVHRLREMMLEEAQNKKPGQATKLFQKYAEKHRPSLPTGKPAYAILPADMTDEEWIARQEELNKTRKPPPEYEG